MIKLKQQINDIHKLDAVSKLSSIVSICHIILFLLWVPLTVMMIKTIDSFVVYGWGIRHEGDLPGIVNSIRSWFLFLVAFYLGVMFVTFYQYWLHRKLNENKWLYFLPTIIPILFVLSLWYVITNRYIINFWYYLRTNRTEPKEISHTEFFRWVSRRTTINKLIKNTILFYFALIIFTIGIFFIIFQGPSSKQSNIDDYWIFNTMSFFTQQNNIMCWIFLLVFGLFHHKVIFKDNLLQMFVCSYISVVGFVALLMIGPYIANQPEGSDFLIPYNAMRFFWLHLVDQVFFIAFTVNTFSVSYSLPRISTKRYLFEGTIYPLFYGMYLYSVPFFAYYSVYGFLTNLNPFMLREDGQPAGNPWWIFGSLGIALVIYFFLWFYRWLNERIVRNNIKYVCS